jgi:hypothetical protein
MTTAPWTPHAARRSWSAAWCSRLCSVRPYGRCTSPPPSCALANGPPACMKLCMYRCLWRGCAGTGEGVSVRWGGGGVGDGCFRPTTVAPSKRALSSGSRRRTCAHLLFRIGIVMKRLMALSGPLVPPLRGCRPCGCLLHSLCRAGCVRRWAGLCISRWRGPHGALHLRTGVVPVRVRAC